MQPKNVPCHIRIKVEPTQKQRAEPVDYTVKTSRV